MTPNLAFGFGGLSITILLLVVLAVAVPTVFWVIQLVDAARREFPDQTVKIVWLLVIFFTHFIGAVVYYFVGKKQGIIPSA